MLHEALQIVHHNNMRNQLKQQRLNQTNQKTERNQSTTNNMLSTPQLNTLGFGSSVAIHKLRESKWFKENEQNILLSVVESGFILERRNSPESDNDWGIALWKPGQEKSKNIEYLTIYILKAEKDKKKIVAVDLTNFWLPSHEIRINNQQDREKIPNNEQDIRKHIEYAKKTKKMNWHNSHHFPYWCRYEKPNLGRVQQISDRVRWNSIGVSVGILLMKHRSRNAATSH